MALALKVPIREAQKWKEFISKQNLFDREYKIIKDNKFIYYPIKQKFQVLKGDVSFAEKTFEKITAERGTLKDNLKGKLTEKEFEFLQTAHDIIGTIAILEIPAELVKHEKLIAEILLKINPMIKTVLKKAASHEGTFRTQKMSYLAGEKTKETIYKENNVRLKLNVETVYFSIRLSNERKRIVELINEAHKKTKKKEQILVMFSGCAPYPVVLAKNTEAKHILGIEINPEGHKYGLENIKLNKLNNVDIICGDVKKVIPRLKKTIEENKENKKNKIKLIFDRILMPLPKTADEFLDEALIVSKKGTIIHFYDFLPEDNFDDAKQKINVACKKRKMKYKILRIVKCGQHAPHVFRICVDFKIM